LKKLSCFSLITIYTFATTQRSTMRLSTFALLALLSSASAFAPAEISTSHRAQTALRLAKNDNKIQLGRNQIEDAKNAFLGTVTAATILMGTLAPLPSDAANAAATIAPATPAATATKTSPVVKKAEPVAAPVPLAAEKAAVASAKAAFTASQKVSI
jgi:hypothetical protein